MKNFDQDWQERKSAEARTFQVGGQVFVMKKAVKPELLKIREDMTEDAPVEEAMAALDDLFLSMIESGEDAEARYRALREDPEGLSIGDMNEVIDWLIQRQTGRPPTQPSGSSPSRGRAGTRSTAGSSRPASAVG